MPSLTPPPLARPRVVPPVPGLLLVSLCAVQILAQPGPLAPPPCPVWIGNPSTGIQVYEPRRNLEMAWGASGVGAGLYTMDTVYPQTNGFNTAVQVDINLSPPAFRRWAIPQNWPGPLTLVADGSGNTAWGIWSNAPPLAMIISNNGELVTVENRSGVSWIVRYQPPAANDPGWVPVEAGLFPFPSPPALTFTIAELTVDQSGLFWVIGYNPAYGQAMALYQWSATYPPPPMGQSPATLTSGQFLAPQEIPTWMCAERLNLNISTGVLWISTENPTTGVGTSLYAYLLVQGTWTGSAGLGGRMVWPDTQMGSNGNGAWVLQKVPGGTDQLIHADAGNAQCPAVTNLTTGSTYFTLQMDKNVIGPNGDGAVVGLTFPAAFEEYTQTACPGFATVLVQVRTPWIGPNLRGAGWNYAQYIATGAVTRY